MRERFLYVYIPCGCLQVSNSKHSSRNVTKTFSALSKVCATVFTFSETQVKELGLVVQTSSPGTKWYLELRKLTEALKSSSCYYCSCWVRILGWSMDQSLHWKLHQGHITWILVIFSLL